ncbi:MAG: hypothetical protein JWR38_1943 [Mucilaginibacter sp.]|nr:hypothetical protein [Mucilaginibacter sp.]
MSNNIDFKAIWQQRDVVVKPDIREVIKKAGQLKKSARNKLLGANGVIIAVTIYYIIFLNVYYDSNAITTRIGGLLTIIGLVAYLIVSNGLLLDLFKSHPETDSFAYLTELMTIKKKQELVHSKVVKMYLITLSAGVALFLIDPAIKAGVMWGSVMYIFLFAWMAFVYFYIAPRKIKKQHAEWSAVIEKLQAINNQLLLIKDME